jgi:hypothetical protein
MKPVVIDTDVASFLFKNDSRAQSYLGHLRDLHLEGEDLAELGIAENPAVVVTMELDAVA